MKKRNKIMKEWIEEEWIEEGWKEESVIIKIIVIILKEKPLNNFDYSPKGA